MRVTVCVKGRTNVGFKGWEKVTDPSKRTAIMGEQHGYMRVDRGEELWYIIPQSWHQKEQECPCDSGCMPYA